MVITEIVAALDAAVREPSKLRGAITELQKIVWQDSEDNSQLIEIVRELMYDLDFYESNVAAKREDLVFIDEKQVIAEILTALSKLKSIDQ